MEVGGPLDIDLDTPEDLVLIESDRARGDRCPADAASAATRSAAPSADTAGSPGGPLDRPGPITVLSLDGIPEIRLGDDLRT